MSVSNLLKEFSSLAALGANEAETRLKLIDRVLTEVLGWTHDDITVEERLTEDGSTTFADYILRTGMTAVVVEAKRIGLGQVSIPNLRRVQLTRRFLEGDLGNAIKQARDYGRGRGIPFAVATNGDFWVIFPASRTDQIGFHDSSAILFPNIESALSIDFAEFIDLLSRKAVISGSLERELLGRVENQIEERRLNRYYTTPVSRISRHSLFPLIEDAIATAFAEDIVNADIELLKKCYVRTPERIRFDNRIDMHIVKRKGVTARSPLRPMKDKDEAALKNKIQTAAGRARPIAILVLGSVGAGKTTFLEYTYRIAAASNFLPDAAKAYAHWFRVEFRGFSKSKNIVDFIHKSLQIQINIDSYLGDYERCIRHAYKSDIDALFRGPLFLVANDKLERERHITSLLKSDYEKVAPYNEKILSYAAKNSPIFLVIDNIDQFEEPEVVSEIFSASMALSHRLGLNLVCSLREETYIQHRSTPSFDAFDFDPIVIDPPEISAVLSKRFFVAKQLLQGRPGHFTAENGADMQLSDMSIIIDMVQSSVLGSEIGNLISVLATSDVRLALRMTREFLQSGYTASGRALQIYQRSGQYILPKHEALRAIMTGNQALYSEKTSVIGNPFDARCGKTEIQLLRLFILVSLVQSSGVQTFQGFTGEEIRSAIREIGYGDDVTLRILQDLCRLRFAYTLSHSPASLDATFVPSRLGGYIIKELIGNFTFLEAAMGDTFIADEEVWQELRRLTDLIYNERDVICRVGFRTTRARVFFSYMKDSYSSLRNESLRRALSSEWCSNPLENIERQFFDNLTQAERSAERNYGPDAAH